jgi:hypothetical protein
VADLVGVLPAWLLFWGEGVVLDSLVGPLWLLLRLGSGEPRTASVESRSEERLWSSLMMAL